jgi:hypothetical protein
MDTVRKGLIVEEVEDRRDQAVRDAVMIVERAVRRPKKADQQAPGTLMGTLEKCRSKKCCCFKSIEDNSIPPLGTIRSSSPFFAVRARPPIDFRERVRLAPVIVMVSSLKTFAPDIGSRQHAPEG